MLYGKHHQQNRLLSSDFHLVDHLQINDLSATQDCNIFFENVEQLTLQQTCHIRDNLEFFIALDRIIPLDRLRKLNLHCQVLSLESLVHFLSLTPNCTQLTLTGQLTNNPSRLSMDIRMNKTTNLTVNPTCTLEQVKFLTKLCSQVQHLSIGIREEELRSIMRYLLSKCNKYTRHLTSLHIQSTGDIYIEKLENEFKSLGRTNKFAIEDISYKRCHIWW